MKRCLYVILISLILLTTLFPVQAYALYEADCITDENGNDITPGIVTCSSQSVDLRTAPDLDSNSISTLVYGDEAAWRGETSVDYRGVTWYYVSRNGIQGWVSSEYTTLRYRN